jgi:hypothetical protein
MLNLSLLAPAGPTQVRLRLNELEEELAAERDRAAAAAAAAEESAEHYQGLVLDAQASKGWIGGLKVFESSRARGPTRASREEQGGAARRGQHRRRESKASSGIGRRQAAAGSVSSNPSFSWRRPR